ncbi:hypothetical protein [Chryseobacterium luquanense]|uniref:DUF4365 domain-containing protein n=1 Tax=Chryseobacterium luquanense TaxID=2983766 RepID=A0ABT3Y846_9FLAO|nr:hypothetical protein [Chryseobacterium luquanense]MCX8534337.1 hypothetical protein [Chryseobacterium luquanense]
MDIKPLQKQAENHISSELLKYEFKVTEPFFDEEGTDLIIVQNINLKKTRFLKVQCKGRNIKNGTSSVVIPISYIEENFVVFLYVIDKDKNDFLYLFLPEQVKEWKINKKNEYFLSINDNKITLDYFKSKLFNKDLSEILSQRLNKAEPKNYTSVLIDGIFLEKAMDKTIEIYSEIWPEKIFVKPDLITVLKNILDSYDKHKSEKKIVCCYVFLSESFYLEERIDCSLVNSNFITNNGNEAKVFISKTNEVIGCEILQQLDRLINNDNIVLVANDIIYEIELEELAEKKVEIIVVKFNQHNDEDMISKFKWGDITYPLGLSIGLLRDEI